MTTESHSENSAYARALGARLRAVRGEAHLSLHGVQRRSDGRWKAVVVGSYERGDRAISVQRLAELAEFYGVPINDLLPGDEPATAFSLGTQPPMPTRVVIDVRRLRTDPDTDGEPGGSAPTEQELAPLRRLVDRVRGQRAERSSATVVLRRGDLEMLAVYYDTDLAGLSARLVRWQVLAPQALILGND
jgi:transcriptional regulator with XRE-family HTH domain